MVGRYPFNSQVGPLDIADYGISFAQFPRALAALTEGDVGYVNTSGYVGRAVATSSSTMRGIGVVGIGGALSGQPLKIITQGFFHSANFNFSGYIGGDLYTPTAAGAPTPIQPSASGQISQVIGQAVDGSGIYVAVQASIQRGGTL